MDGHGEGEGVGALRRFHGEADRLMCGLERWGKKRELKLRLRLAGGMDFEAGDETKKETGGSRSGMEALRKDGQTIHLIAREDARRETHGPPCNQLKRPIFSIRAHRI